jgi:N-carbamoylputrescine amidase
MRESRTETVLGLVQMACNQTPEANLATALDGIAEAASRGAQVICLPELFRSHYFCQEENADWFDLAESIPGPTTDALSSAAKKHGVVIVGSVFERRSAGVYHNSSVVINVDGELLGIYRKMHIPDDPLFYEKFYFTPGDLGFRVFETPFGRIAPLICWDQWYPEAARLAALAGAEILVYPTAIGWHPGEKQEWGERQHAAWQTMQRSHAIANGLFVAAINRVGLETPLANSPSSPANYAGLEFWGRSFVCGPLGEIVAEAGADETVVLVSCDLGEIDQTRRQWPFLRDRRIDAYADITKRVID